jgi:nitrile hydratase subunit beta
VAEAAVDGIHDLGGMHGFGPVGPEAGEPVFHEPWEGRLFAMRVSFPGLFGRPGGARYAIEQLDPAFQLTASYYECWLASFVAGLLARGALTAEELAERERHYTANPTGPVPRHDDPAQAAQALARLRRRPQLDHAELSIRPRFAPEASVRVVNVHPAGHTRLPRYVRGRWGVVLRCHGVHDVPDHERNDDPIPPPQPVYRVQFTMAELWGPGAEPGALGIDIWESHLEPA